MMIAFNAVVTRLRRRRSGCVQSINLQVANRYSYAPLSPDTTLNLLARSDGI